MTECITLNPAYMLRQDGNRVILYGEEDERYHSEEWFSFIHPFYGMLLSVFSLNGKNKEEKLKICSTFFDKPIIEIGKIINKFIENPQPITIITRNGSRMSFPKKLLICTEKPINRNKEYQISDFSYIGTPDYNTNRLEFPLNINLELNMQCLTDCCYCYADRKCSTKNTLKTSRIIELIHEARNYNLKNFDINGGEVMMHPDIRIILKELKRCGFDPLVSTKIPLDIETLRFFKEIDLRKFQISLDSSNDNVLSQMLHTPKGYIDDIKTTLSNACKLNIEVGINTVLTKYNGDIQQIEALMQLLSEYNCIKKVRLNPTGYSLYKSNFNNIKMSIRELEAIESQLPSWQDLYGIRVSLSPYDCKYMFSGKYKNEKFPTRALCTGNVWNMVILPDGKVTICEELYKKSNFIIAIFRLFFENLLTAPRSQVFNPLKI